jgi:leucyl-tRNA synthetase
MSYNFTEIEEKWQKYWVENKTFKAENNSQKPKYYVLDMFPYPSGSGLHVGHPLGYIASDIISRYKRSNGFNVLHPMGFDSFGLPAEQYAIKTGQHPKETTDKNIIRFKYQLDKLGLSFDWDREIKTSDSTYYKWTQWIFLKLFNSYYDNEHDKAQPIKKLKIPKNMNDEEKESYVDSKRLAYVDTVDVNWCEELGTVLANEEVIGGLSERGGFPVVKRPMKQWVMRITDYADRLLNDLTELDWPESIKLSQKNWIGKSEGAQIKFPIDKNNYIEVFTTRPDTIFGATYLVLAPEHPLINKITTDEFSKEISHYIEETSKKSDLERQENEKNKTGVFTGAYAQNPISKKKVPIWISDYVLSSYGTGAIMAVPAHDERDNEFAKKFNLDINRVIDGGNDDEFYTGNGEMINSGNYNNIDNVKFKSIVIELLENENNGKKTTNYKLRDWIFTRQRYWGEPIPIIYDGNKKKSLDLQDLPLELPEVESYLPTNDGLSPLARNNDWVNISIDGKDYMRETNTMPQWAGSCWYFLRFLDPNNNNEFANKDFIKYWMPVDLYIGGAEHAVLHLLYARFWHKVLYDLDYVNTSEPFKKLVNQGMILGKSAFIHRIINTNDFISLDLKKNEVTQKIHVDIAFVDEKNRLDIDKLKNNNPEFKDVNFIKNETFYVSREIEKMSKSRYNVVSPDDICKKYGADTLRMYEMFLGPIDQSKPWNTAGITGVFSFLNKFWNLFFEDDKFYVTDDPPSMEVLKIYHQTVKKVIHDIDKFSFNTSVSAFMICINELTSKGCNSRDILSNLCVLLSPFAPHICEEIWSLLGNKSSISIETYPEFDEKFLEESVIEYPVSFNGKLRFKISLPSNVQKNEVELLISEHELTNKYLEGKSIKKIIFVPKKIINIVC